MAAIAFDPLEYTHDLEAVGVPREQAEVHARAMTDRFIHNFDALVTTDYLDSRLSESEAWVDKRFTEFQAQMDKRFTKVDTRFTELEGRMDKRFTESDARVEKRFAESDAKMDAGFSRLDLEFAGIKGQFKLVYWKLAVIIASTVIPAIQDVYSSL